MPRVPAEQVWRSSCKAEIGITRPPFRSRLLRIGGRATPSRQIVLGRPHSSSTCSTSKLTTTFCPSGRESGSGPSNVQNWVSSQVLLQWFVVRGVLVSTKADGGDTGPRATRPAHADAGRLGPSSVDSKSPFIPSSTRCPAGPGSSCPAIDSLVIDEPEPRLHLTTPTL